MKRITILALGALMPLVALAQQPNPKPVSIQPPAPAMAAVAPALTPSEQFTMADYERQIGALLEQMVPLQQKRQAFIQALNASHPGWEWHDGRSKDDYTGFVQVGSPPAPKQQK